MRRVRFILQTGAIDFQKDEAEDPEDFSNYSGVWVSLNKRITRCFRLCLNCWEEGGNWQTLYRAAVRGTFGFKD